MQIIQPSKPRGRPKRDDQALSRDRILSTAMALVLGGASEVSMRGVASALGVNVMALYYYFRDRQALHEALIAHSFEPLNGLHKRLERLPAGEPRLRLLADTYLRCAAQALPLTRYLALKGGESLSTCFDRLFVLALGKPSPHAPSVLTMRDVMVDYLHGAALAGPKTARRSLAHGWPVLMSGFQQCI
jgi:AcrR family transcriptional regulator